MNKIWWYLILGGLLLYILKRPLAAMYQKRVSGLEAVADAATLNGYTTYNTQVYSSPIWQPFLQFIKAGSFNPGSKGNASQVVDYSVQG